MKTIKSLLLAFLLLTTFTVQAKAEDIKTIETTEFLNLLTANEGKIILVNFFATWCPPCREEIPDIVKIRNEFPEDEVVIIGLSLDENPALLPDFMKEHAINYPVYVSSIDLAYAYGVQSIPHNIVYDKNLKPLHNYPGIISYDDVKMMITSTK